MQEARGKEHVQVELVDGRLVVLITCRRAPHNPQEPLPARLQPRRHLLDLLRAKPARAAKTEKHHTGLGLVIEPCEALVALCANPNLLGLYEWSYAVQWRRWPSGGAEAGDDGVDGTGLQERQLLTIMPCELHSWWGTSLNNLVLKLFRSRVNAGR